MKQFLTIILSVLFLHNHAQETSNPFTYTVVPPSPEAWSYQQYGKFDNNYYTGAINVDIPIGNIKSGSIEIPIGLSYGGANGIKVEEVPGWTGLGWSLTAGGVITRVTRSLPDDFGIYPSIKIGLVDLVSNQENFSDSGSTSMKLISQGKLDAEPDQFFLNLAGYQCTFYMYREDIYSPIEVMTKPVNDLIIEPIIGNYVTPHGQIYPEKIIGFHVVDPNGNKYEFTITEGNETYVMGENTYTDPTIVSAYYLSKVSNVNNTDEVNFEYDDEVYTTYAPTSNNYMAYGGDDLLRIRKTKTYGKRIRKIIGRNFDAHFIASSNSRVDVAGNRKYLSAIELRDKNNSVLQKTDFDYSYFDENGTSPITDGNNTGLYYLYDGSTGVDIGDYKKRLKLDKVTQTGRNGIGQPMTHILEYENDVFLPDRLSFAQDHWGYYNGRDENLSLLPLHKIEYFNDVMQHTVRLVSGISDREANQEFSKAGILNKIQYPTGGFSEFVYENHQSIASCLKNNYDITSFELDNLIHSSETITVNNLTDPFSIASAVLFQPTYPVGCRVTISFVHQSNPSLTRHISIGNYEESGSQQAEMKRTEMVYLEDGTYDISISTSDDTNNNGCNFSDGVMVRVSVEKELPTDIKIVGGVRISEVKNYTSEGVLATRKHYEYTDEQGIESGQIYSNPVYGFKYGSVTPHDDGSFHHFSSGWIQSVNSVNPLYSGNGKHIVYPIVKEYLLDSNGESLGETLYEFESFENHPDQIYGSVYVHSGTWDQIIVEPIDWTQCASQEMSNPFQSYYSGRFNFQRIDEKSHLQGKLKNIRIKDNSTNTMQSTENSFFVKTFNQNAGVYTPGVNNFLPASSTGRIYEVPGWSVTTIANLPSSSPSDVMHKPSLGIGKNFSTYLVLDKAVVTYYGIINGAIYALGESKVIINSHQEEYANNGYVLPPSDGGIHETGSVFPYFIKSGLSLPTETSRVRKSRVDLNKNLTNSSKLIYNIPPPLDQSYNFYTMPTSSEVEVSKGEFLITEYKYPPDYTNVNPQSDQMSMAISKMVEKNMILPKMEEVIYRKKGESDTPVVISAQLVEYKYDSSNENILPYKVYTIERNSPITNFVKSYTNSNGFQKDSRYKLLSEFVEYDEHGNIQESKDKLGRSTVYLWAYDSSKPIAMFNNITVNELNSIFDTVTLSNYTSNAQIKNILEQYRSNIPVESTMTGFLYDPVTLQLQTIIDENGVETTYEYDVLQRLKTIKNDDNYVITNYVFNFPNSN